MVSYRKDGYLMISTSKVLILVVVEDGLVLVELCAVPSNTPSLNPCCSGRWSRTRSSSIKEGFPLGVLILVVVEDGLVL